MLLWNPIYSSSTETEASFCCDWHYTLVSNKSSRLTMNTWVTEVLELLLENLVHLYVNTPLIKKKIFSSWSTLNSISVFLLLPLGHYNISFLCVTCFSCNNLPVHSEGQNVISNQNIQYVMFGIVISFSLFKMVLYILWET